MNFRARNDALSNNRSNPERRSSVGQSGLEYFSHNDQKEESIRPASAKEIEKLASQSFGLKRFVSTIEFSIRSLFDQEFSSYVL